MVLRLSRSGHSPLRQVAALAAVLTMQGCGHTSSPSEAPDNAAFMQRLHALSNEQISLRVSAYRIKASAKGEGRFQTEFPTVVSGTPGARSAMVHTETVGAFLKLLSTGGRITLAGQSSTMPIPSETVSLPLYPPRNAASVTMQAPAKTAPMLLLTSGITSCGEVELAYAMVRLATPDGSIDKVEAGARLVQAPGTDISFGKDFIASGSVMVLSYSEPGSLDHVVLTISPAVIVGMATPAGAPLVSRYEK